MLVHLVVRPEALDPAHFDTPGYLENALVLLRGVQENGLLLVDPDGDLLDQLLVAAERLPTRRGQELQALLAEICKPDKSRKRVVALEAKKCPRVSAGDLTERVRAAGMADAVVVEPATASSAPALPLSGYLMSDVEGLRRFLAGGLPEAARLDGTGPHALTFDTLIARATRFSRWVRFYDKQVGRVNNLPRFAAGIERVLRVWLDAAHFPADTLRAELYTVADPHRSPADCRQILVRQLINPLKENLKLRDFALYLRDDPTHEFHARYLQTQNVAVHFDRGFDFLAADGSIMPGVVVKLGGNCLDLLARFRKQAAMG